MRLASSVSTPVSRAKLLRGNGICVGSIFLFSLAFPAADLLLQDWGVLGLILIRNMLAFGLILLLFIALLGAQGLRDLQILAKSHHHDHHVKRRCVQMERGNCDPNFANAFHPKQLRNSHT